MSRDTVTSLNAGTGGDNMDESAVVQSDGETLAKRPRVELAHAVDGTPRLVSKDHPLSVEFPSPILGEILHELREIRLLLIAALVE